MVNPLKLGFTISAAGGGDSAREVLLMENALKQVREENKRVQQTAAQLKDAYNLDDTEIKQVIDQMEKLQKETEQTKREVGGLDNLLEGLGQGLGQGVFDTVVGLASGAVEGIKEVIGSTLEVGVAAEQSRVAFTTLLGSAEEADQVIQDLNNFAANTPFEFPGVREAGQQLIAFKFDTDEVIPSLERVGNVAAGVGTDFNELATLYGKARVQGRLFAEDINQLTERGIPIIGELAEQFGVTEQEVKGLVETGQVGFDNIEQAFISMTSEGGLFFNLMEEQSKTVGGQISNLSDRFTQLQESVFNAFQPALAAGLQLFSDVLEEAGQRSGGLDAISDAGERLQQALEDNPEIAEALGEAIAFLSDNLVDLLADGLNGLADWLNENPEKFQEFTQYIQDQVERGRFYLDILVKIVQVLGQFISVLLRVRSGISDFTTTFLTGLGQIQAAVGLVRGEVNALGEELSATMGDAATQGIDAATTAFDNFGSIVNSTGQQVQDSSQTITQAITEQNSAFEARNRQLRLDELAAQESLASRDATQQDSLASEQEFLDRRIALNTDRLDQLRSITEASGANPQQVQAAQDEILKIEEQNAQLRVQVAQKSLAAQQAAEAELRQERIEAAQEEAEAIRERRETESTQQEEAFQDQQNQEEEAFRETQRTTERAFNDAERQKEKAFQDSQNTRQESFNDDQRRQQQEFQDRQQAAEKAFADAQDRAREDAESRFAGRRQEIERQLQLEAAESPEERQRLEDEFAAADEEAQRREQAFAQLEAEEEAFREQQQAEEEAFRQAQREEARAFELAQREEEKAFEAELNAEQQAFELAQREAQDAFEQEQRDLEKAFNESQRDAEAAFKEQQRQLDEASADRIAAILDRAENGPIQSLREGGVTTGPVTQVHKDEFIVAPRGSRVVSQRESRDLVRAYLGDRDVASRSFAPGAVVARDVTAPTSHAVEQKLDDLLRAVKANGKIQMGGDTLTFVNEPDPIQASVARQQAKMRELASLWRL